MSRGLETLRQEEGGKFYIGTSFLTLGVQPAHLDVATSDPLTMPQGTNS